MTRTGVSVSLIVFEWLLDHCSIQSPPYCGCSLRRNWELWIPILVIGGDPSDQTFIIYPVDKLWGNTFKVVVFYFVR